LRNHIVFIGDGVRFAKSWSKK